MKTRHFLQLLFLSALWGASLPLLRIASPLLGPWVVAGMRCLLAAIVLSLLMYALREKWPTPATWPQLALLSILTVVTPFVLFNLAALVIPAGYSSVLNATSPLFGVLGAAAVGEEKLTSRRLFGCVIGFAGVALLVRLGPVAVTQQVVWAALGCLAAAASYGFGAILMKRATLTHEPLPVSAAVHVAAAGILLVPMGVTAPSAHVTTAAVLAVAAIGIITSGFLYWASMRLMREISASAATSAAFMIPLFGVTWGAIFLNEKVNLAMLPGCRRVLAATALISGFNPFRGAPPEP